MPRCSETALETALRGLSEHAATSRVRSNWMSTYLVAQRMTAERYPYTIVGADRAVTDLFVLLPAHPRGRSNPFVDLASEYRWLQVEHSGRKTVWNTGTRNGAQTVLFDGLHFKNGLLPNAIDVLLERLGGAEPLPGRDALAVLLTRDHDWPAQPTRAELHRMACAVLGLSLADFERLTADIALAVPVVGEDEWSSAALEASDLGPLDGNQDVPQEPVEYIPIDSIHELPTRFRRFLAHHGITPAGDEELVDLLAAILSSQFIIMAGPSGSGKSLLASALAAFFAPPDRRCRLTSARLLARSEEFLGYYSQFAGEQFTVYEPLQLLLEVRSADGNTPPMVTIEEANLSPIEGYLAPLVHGLGSLEERRLSFSLHHQAAAVGSQLPGMTVPRSLDLEPYPRFLATINVDADSPAPARKVVSRACVVLLETPSFETAVVAAGKLVHPSVEEGTGPAAALIGRPTIALHRYTATGSEQYEQALAARAELLRAAIGFDVIGHRQVQRSLVYMAWYVELSGATAAEADPEDLQPTVDAAADNALLHFILPSLTPTQFEQALSALDDRQRRGVLAPRVVRLRALVSDQQFGPSPDFWGALS